MGNALFTIAGCIGIAVRSGQPYAFPKLVLYDMTERFGSQEDIELHKYLVNPLPEVPYGIEFQTYGYFWDYRDVFLPSGNWTIDAHLQSERYFAHCIDIIRYHFTFKDEYPKSDAVAVHYRAGDYIDDPRAYHPRCSIEYYRQAIAQFPKGTTFKVFSDNTEEFIKKINGINREYKFEYDMTPTNYIEDFKKMKACKSFICANSSYSHMAALLGDHPEKKIIMPKLWFGEQANGLSFDSLYPAEAVVI